MRRMPHSAALAACLALLVAGPAPAETRTTVADTVQAGRDRFLSNALSASFSPTEDVTLDAGAGRSRSGTVLSDSSIGGGVWARLVPRVAVSLHLDRFNGEKGYAVDPVTFDLAGDSAKAQRTTTVSAEVTVKVWDAEKKPDEPEGDAADPLVREAHVAAGGSRGTLHVPVDTPGPRGRLVTADFTQRQSSVSGGAGAEVAGTDFEATYERHRYGDLSTPAGATALHRPVLERIVQGIRTSVAQVLAEPVAYHTLLSVSEPLPHDLAVYASWDYAVLELTRGIARTTTAELTWDATRWLGIKAGGLWVRERRATTAYGMGGISLSF